VVWLKVLFGLAALAGAITLAVILIRFNRKRLLIVRAAAAATETQLEDVYRFVEAGGTEIPNGFILARTNASADDTSCIVSVPTSLEEFPWAGRSIAVRAERDVQFRFVEDVAQTTRLLGRKYRPVAVPRYATESGKLRNRFAPAQYIKQNAELRGKLETICAAYPEELLSYLLCAGRESFEFEPIDQARIGTSAAWVQNPEFRYCDACRKRMVLILQLPGTLVHRKAFHRGTFYFFGCKHHSERTSTVAQFT
jgi:hypothetical protein